ncbi:MAG: YdcH family protein [Hyphomonadaceae bacterium]|jgi:hypothetical protein|nr:YdcH family protein [Hyphomonadaceae bacterium]
MGRERLRSLRARHAELDARLSIELARPAPDATAIRALKRQKLLIKDELSRWEEARMISA